MYFHTNNKMKIQFLPALNGLSILDFIHVLSLLRNLTAKSSCQYVTQNIKKIN